MADSNSHPAVNAIQDLANENEALKQRLSQQEAEIELLRNTVTGANPSANTQGISLDTLYVSAWSEINTRLQTRQVCMNAFAALSIPLVGGLVGYLFNFFKDWDGKDSEKLNNLVYSASIFGIFIPLFAVVFIFWIVQHDYLICFLQKYCASIEDRSNLADELKWHHKDNMYDSTVPIKHPWTFLQVKYRRFVHLPFLFLVGMTSVPPVVLAIYRMNVSAVIVLSAYVGVLLIALRITNKYHLGKSISGIGMILGPALILLSLYLFWIFGKGLPILKEDFEKNWLLFIISAFSVTISYFGMVFYMFAKNKREIVANIPVNRLVKFRKDSKAWNFICGDTEIRKAINDLINA